MVNLNQILESAQTPPDTLKNFVNWCIDEQLLPALTLIMVNAAPNIPQDLATSNFPHFVTQMGQLKNHLVGSGQCDRIQLMALEASTYLLQRMDTALHEGDISAFAFMLRSIYGWAALTETGAINQQIKQSAEQRAEAAQTQHIGLALGLDVRH
ncbi:hypothetical protein MASR2M15_17930 [Anaerolineales bacterium]